MYVFLSAGDIRRPEPGTYPADIWCENDVVLTLMRRDYVASTLIQRHFDTKCPLGTVWKLVSSKCRCLVGPLKVSRRCTAMYRVHIMLENIMMKIPSNNVIDFLLFICSYLVYIVCMCFY